MIQPSVQVDTRLFNDWVILEPERVAEARRLFNVEGGFLVASEMAKQAPYRTGRLINSITKEETPEGFKVYPKAPYAKFVEEGTGIFGPRFLPIFPRRAKVLRFKINGKTIFARYVKGQRGQFFVKRTSEVVKPRLRELLGKIWRKVHG